MTKHTTVKKSLILLVAALLCVAVLFAACNSGKFTPVTMPTGEGIESNGGIAVRYGDWIYYVNGYESNVNATNTYVDTKDAPRVGSVVRIEISKLEEVLAIHDQDELSGTEKTKAIAKAVFESAQVVVPKIYYAGNTSTPTLNGIFIFGDRLYILTPNDELTPGGNPQTSQSVLMSFKLDGSDPVRHFTFTDNTAQIWLYESGNKVLATYLMSSQLHVLDVASGTDTPIKNADDETATVSSVKFDEAGKCVFFLDEDGAICKLDCGKTAQEVIVANEIPEGKDVSPISFTISEVNNGYVYYTVANSEDTTVDNQVLYYANSDNKVATVDGARKVAYNSSNLPSGWKPWKDNMIVSVENKDGFYGLRIIASVDGSEIIQVLKRGYNDQSVVINKIDGDKLYYTVNSVTYVKNLADFVGENATGDTTDLGEVYAASWSTSASVGWATPDVVKVVKGDVTTTYMFTLSTGSVSVVKFDPEKKSNGTATTLTLAAVTEE